MKEAFTYQNIFVCINLIKFCLVSNGRDIKEINILHDYLIIYTHEIFLENKLFICSFYTQKLETRTNYYKHINYK